MSSKYQKLADESGILLVFTFPYILALMLVDWLFATKGKS